MRKRPVTNFTVAVSVSNDAPRLPLQHDGLAALLRCFIGRAKAEAAQRKQAEQQQAADTAAPSEVNRDES